MDIYQIWTTYNKQWSRYEILAFVGVLILVCTTMAVYVHRKRLNIIQAAAVLALVVFLGIVFGSTVFTRTVTIRQYELVPFWSWRDIIRYHDCQQILHPARIRVFHRVVPVVEWMGGNPPFQDVRSGHG